MAVFGELHGARGLLSLAVTIAVTSPAAAQDDQAPGGPIVVTERDELEFLNLENIQLSLEFVAQRRIDTRKDSSGTIRQTEDLLAALLEITSGGSIVHPNLIELDLSFGMLLEYADIDLDDDPAVGGTGRFDNPENIFLFDVSALILRESDTPLTIYGRRTQTFIDRQFADTLDVLVTEYGARLAVRGEMIPSFFQYYHRVSEQDADIGRSDFEIDQHTFEWQSQARIGDNQVINWEYAYDNVDESGDLRLPNTFERHDAFGYHELFLDPNRRSTWRNSVNYYRETGLFPIDRIRFSSRLRLYHSETLRSTFDYVFEDQDREQSDQRQHRGVATLRHQLFDSLTTTFSGGGSHLNATPDFTSDQYFASLTFDYSKRVPWGFLTATSGLAYNHQDDSEIGTALQITDQVETFSPAGFIFLDRRNIITSTIVITDLTGFIIYSEGLDYTVQSFPDRVEIRRVIGGNIAPEQTVLIDYLVGPQPANKTDTWSAAITARYAIEEGALRGLDLYLRYLWQDQERSSDDPLLGEEADVDDITLGLEYEFWKMTILGEYQMRDSNISPFDLIRLEAQYNERFGRDSRLLITGRYDQIDRTDEDLRTATTTVTAQWDQQFNDELFASLMLRFLNQNDNSGLDSIAFEQDLVVTWQRGRTTVFGRIDNIFTDNETGPDTSFQTFRIGVRREF